ncbi:RNA/RNP complex-1-interacting phosphatase [Colias croceus]|uniref:RNA/RNP complex-1-interacting phosphatase n=1 Tax=Colias crocea TaxID=72248 RepID=UPI001E27D315|nr:RNA/RNP complex-1-interacting phosphatase [Colias croceus]
MAPKIPDRWIPYKAFGKVIEGTRIICFKVPLHRRWQSKNNEIWDIKTLLEKIPKLGAVIDLTNTQRYYDPQELQSAGVLHKKILMEGRVIPPEHKVTEFLGGCSLHAWIEPYGVHGVSIPARSTAVARCQSYRQI